MSIRDLRITLAGTADFDSHHHPDSACTQYYEPGNRVDKGDSGELPEKSGKSSMNFLEEKNEMP